MATLAPTASNAQTAGLCHTCDTALPLSYPLSPEHEAIWLCAQCGLPVAASCLAEELQGLGAKVRLHDRNFDTTGLPPISGNLRRQVTRMIKTEPSGEVDNRRRSIRIEKSIVVPAVRLADNGNPTGSAFNIMVANLSAEGIGLVHSDRIATRKLILQLPTQPDDSSIQMVIRVVRQRALAYPFWEIGGEFMVRLGTPQSPRYKLPIDSLPKA